MAARKTKAYCIHWSESTGDYSKTFYVYTKREAKTAWENFMKENGLTGRYRHTIILRNR
jgi:hypothetical protein